MSAEAPSEASPKSSFPDDVDWTSRLDLARGALVEETPRVLALLRSVGDRDARAIGEWSVGEVAAHVSHVAAAEAMLATGVATGSRAELPVEDDLVGAAARLNDRMLEGDPERDPSVLADRIEESIATFLGTIATVRGDEPVSWLGGTVIPAAALATHLLEELLVHGYDVARAESRRWSIVPSHAALAFGFVLDLMRYSPESVRRGFVRQERARGVRVTYDFRIRGSRRDFVVIEDGVVTIEDPSPRGVDCRISAHPEAALLVGMGRLGPVTPALSGRIAAWGRKPWLALRMSSLLRPP